MKKHPGWKGRQSCGDDLSGIPVPPGFTISTEICTHFTEAGGKLPDWVRPAVQSAMTKVESKIGKKFGDVNNPLLVSVRSGARASMPGMMDTILNLGLNDQTVEGLAKSSNNPRFAWDSYRRFIQMYSDVVMGMNSSLLEVTLEDMKEEKHYKLDTEMNVRRLKTSCQKIQRPSSSNDRSIFPRRSLGTIVGSRLCGLPLLEYSTRDHLS